MNVSTSLAEFATSFDFDDVPEAVSHEASRTLLNLVALSANGAGHEASAQTREVAERDGGVGGACTALGIDTRYSPSWAALLNGIAAHVEDFDDTHLATFIHAGAPIVPAVLVAAETADVSGSELLSGIITGVEVAFRVGLGLMPGHWERGYHLTSTCGVLGAAVGAGRCLSLTPEQMKVAIGLASAQASGVLSMLGTNGKALHAGHAARCGWLAAQLALAGYTSGDIEGPLSYSQALSPTWDPETILDGLGSRWEILNNTYKPYACGIVAHPAIDAAIVINSNAAFDVNKVKAIELRSHPSVSTVMGNQRPTTSLEGKFSVYHAIAAGLLHGRGGVPEFSDASVTDENAARLRLLTTIVDDDTLTKAQAHVSVELESGEVITEHVENARGSAARPLSDDELTEKVRLLLEPTLGSSQTGELIQGVWSLGTAPSITDWLALATPGGVAASA